MKPKTNQNIRDDDEIRQLKDRLRLHDDRYEVISRMLLGESLTGQQGLLQRQAGDDLKHEERKEEDRKRHKEITDLLHDFKKQMRVMDTRIENLQREFAWYQGVLRLPTTKKFWIGTVIILAILVILSHWTRGAYTMIEGAAVKYYHKYF